MNGDGLVIAAVRPADRADWQRLFAGYCAFYNVTSSQSQSDLVWAWLHEPSSPATGLLARSADGTAVGLVHYRTWQWTLQATVGCFLDDLFVDPAYRRHGAARALIAAVAEIAERNGWRTVRWITRQGNADARRLYDQVATATDLVTYDLAPGGVGQ